MYIHLPFCIHRCVYCDFVVVELKKKAWLPRYIEYLKKEIHHYGNREDIVKSKTVDTLYFGGGTPSLFPPETIKDLIDSIRLSFSTDKKMEVTLEANPCSVTADKLLRYKEAGVNRLSYGVQTFSEKHLKTLERVHSKKQAYLAIENAKKVGIMNINVDLIFGIPAQTLEELTEDIWETLKLDLAHISTYGLAVDKTNPLYPKLPTDILQAEMYRWLCDFLPAQGYTHYETSAFVKYPYTQCLHNLKYWMLEDYLGLGVGAYSFIRSKEFPSGMHFKNAHSLSEYEQRMTELGYAREEEEILTQETAKKDYLITRLRLLDRGLDLDDYEFRFNESIMKSYGYKISRLLDQGFLDSQGNVLKLTLKGKLFMNQALLELM